MASVRVISAPRRDGECGVAIAVKLLHMRRQMPPLPRWSAVQTVPDVLGGYVCNGVGADFVSKRAAIRPIRTQLRKTTGRKPHASIFPARPLGAAPAPPDRRLR